MSIQSNINQTISLAGLLFQRSQIAEEMSKTRATEKRAKKTEAVFNTADTEQTENTEKIVDHTIKLGEKQGKSEEDIVKDVEDVYTRQPGRADWTTRSNALEEAHSAAQAAFYQKPTAENLKHLSNLSSQMKGKENMEKYYEKDLEAEKAEEDRQKMASRELRRIITKPYDPSTDVYLPKY